MHKKIFIFIFILSVITIPLANTQTGKILEKVAGQNVHLKSEDDKKDQQNKEHFHLPKSIHDKDHTAFMKSLKDFSIYKSQRVFSPTNLWWCKESSCNKIFEFYISPTNKFRCTEKYIEIWYKYKDSNNNNQIEEKLGYLTKYNNVSNFQAEDKCLKIKKYEVNKESTLLVMDNNYQIVNNENLYNTIWNNLYQTNSFMVLVFYSLGYYNEQNNIFMVSDLYMFVSGVIANLVFVAYIFKYYIWVKIFPLICSNVTFTQKQQEELLKKFLACQQECAKTLEAAKLVNQHATIQAIHQPQSLHPYQALNQLSLSAYSEPNQLVKRTNTRKPKNINN